MAKGTPTMKKHTMTRTLVSVLTAGLLLNGCQRTAEQELPEESAAPDTVGTAISEAAEEESTAAPDPTSVETTGNTLVSQGGPYGEISLSVPENWRCETCPMDSGQLIYGLYGIRLYPENVADGYIALGYIDNFGVCGTGLAEEQTTIAGHPASIGIFDNHTYWDFIAFADDYKGIVALTYSVEDWWDTYSGQVLEILDTLSFDPSTREGGAYVYSRESEVDQIGLSFSLKKISSTGATLLLQNYDASAPTGQLEYGDDFAIEIQRDGIWDEVPVSPEGNYAFHDTAYTISTGDSSEQELNWEWLYGTLAPGTYRIKKSVLDFRAPGDYDKYTVYAQFILNELPSS